jgi:hypothetical protein
VAMESKIFWVATPLYLGWRQYATP